MTEKTIDLRDRIAVATISALISAGHEIDDEQEMHVLAKKAYLMAFWAMIARDEMDAYEPETV